MRVRLNVMENFEMFKKFFTGVTTSHDEIVVAFVPQREQFVNCEQTKRNY